MEPEAARILLLEPVTPSLMEEEVLRDLREVLDGRTRLDHIALQEGPPSIETDEEVAQATPEILRVTEQSQNDYDAIVVGCIGDAGVASARQQSRVPVIGPGEAAMQLASIYGSRFSVIVATPNGVAEMSRLARTVGLGERLASVRSLGIPIASIAGDRSRTKVALVQQASLAADADGASSVIIGCGVAAPAWREAQKALAETNPGVRLIEPLTWAMVLAQSLARFVIVSADGELAAQAAERL